jgi:DNA adenine methylase
MDTASPIVKWAGGKRRLAKHLLQHLRPHVCYVEPFCGGLGFFLAKPPSKVEVINDTHRDLVNLYWCVKWHWQELDREIAGLVNSRELFRTFNEQVGVTDIQRAARWLYRQALCFGDNVKSYGVQRLSGGGMSSSLLSIRARMEALHRRLDRVSIEHLDWTRCVEVYDGPQTFFFFDPPYTHCDQRAYETWTAAHMAAVRDRVDRLKGGFVLTVNDCAENRRIFRGFKLRAVDRARGNKGVGERYGELIITA